MMENFKLVIPSEVELPRTLRITLPDHQEITVEVCFCSAKNTRVVDIKLDSATPTTLHGPDHRTTELLSQMDMESSGGFIPPDIASQLEEEYADEIVDASQGEEEEQPTESVIPGLYSPARPESRDRKMDSSFEDDCFVPATQQRKHDKTDTDDEVEAVIVSSDEEEEEPITDLTAVARTGNNPSPQRRSASREESPPKIIDIDEEVEGPPQSAIGVHDLTKERDEDSEDSFAGVPMIPDSQPVEPIIRKKFVKKKNMVVLSSDDEEDDAPGEVNRGLPDFETEPSTIQANEAETVRTVIAAENSTLNDQPNPPIENVGRNSQDAPEEENEPRSEQVLTDRKTNPEAFDEDAEILTGVQIVEDTQNQTPPPSNAPQSNQDQSEEKIEIPETEDQQNAFEFKAPKSVSSHSPIDLRTQDSLRLTLLSESEKAGAPSQNQAPGDEKIPESTNEEGDFNDDATTIVYDPFPNERKTSPPAASRNRPQSIIDRPENSHNACHRLDETIERRDDWRVEANGVAEDCDEENTPESEGLGSAIYCFLDGGVDLALTGCTASDYVFLREFDQYPSDWDRRSRVKEWLKNLDPGPNLDYAKEIEEGNSLATTVALLSTEDSPVIETANDTIIEDNTREGVEGEVETSIRKRSFPGPCLRSPEKRLRNNRPPSANRELPPKASSAKTLDLETTKISSPQPEAGDDREPRDTCKDDEVPELVPIGSPSQSARKNLRRKQLYNSEEGPSQPVSKIVDSQEVEKFALPSAARPSERTPLRRTAVKSVRTPRPVFKGNTGTESITRSTRRTPARQKDNMERDIGISVFVQAPPNESAPATRSRAARTPTPQQQYTSRKRNSAKEKALQSPKDEVLVAETFPDDKKVEKLSKESIEVEETPAQEAASTSTESLPARRSLRSRKARSSGSSKSDLPDPYAKDTIEVDPPAATRTRSSSKISESTDPASGMVEFSEEINPELVESRPLRPRQGSTGPNARASRVRSLSNIVEQSVPKRSRLIRKSSSSITISARNGRENKRSIENQIEDPNSSVHSIGSSDSSIGVSRWAKARVMFTGIDNPPRHEVIKLGLKLTDIMSQCNVVVAAKFTRTVKMMYAMAKGIPVVSSDWVLESAQARKVLSIENFMLRDPIAEQNFNFKLEDTLRLASEVKFFKGWNFYVTKSCAPNAEQLGEILSGCDGKVVAKIPTKFAENTVIVSCAADRKLLPKKPPVPVVSVEFVFHGILHHELDFETFEVKLQ